MKTLRVAMFVLICPLMMFAEVRLPHSLSDHAVLQRDQPVRIWGWAAPGEQIQVDFHDQKMLATADADGAWELWLRPEKAGGPYTLNVNGSLTGKKLVRADILVGDVWFASGQSNMELPLQGWSNAPLKDAEKEIAAASHPRIRLLVQSKRTSAAPLDDSSDSWQICSPETAKDFSAVAYFFGRRIADEENVPVGLIDSTWGGSPAHAWISDQGLAWSNLPSVAYDAGKIAKHQGQMNAVRENQRLQNEAARASGKPEFKFDEGAMWGRGEHGGSWTPAALFNGMVAPYTRYAIKGVIWYQGETDHEGIKALNYSRVFPALIQDWRKQWAEGNFPFLFVQISSFNGGAGWSAVRDAQRRTLDLVNTGMAVTLDVGLADNVHPPDKQTVGARLAQSALGIAYGRKVESASPLFVRATTEGNAIRAWFAHADGLHASSQAIGDFEIAGNDGKWSAATAGIETVAGQSTVVASSPEVPNPTQIRYGWQPVVTSYLYNAAGLPMSTFTTESDAEMLVW